MACHLSHSQSTRATLLVNSNSTQLISIKYIFAPIFVLMPFLDRDFILACYMSPQFVNRSARPHCLLYMYAISSTSKVVVWPNQATVAVVVVVAFSMYVILCDMQISLSDNEYEFEVINMALIVGCHRIVFFFLYNLFDRLIIVASTHYLLTTLILYGEISLCVSAQSNRLDIEMARCATFIHVWSCFRNEKTSFAARTNCSAVHRFVHLYYCI